MSSHKNKYYSLTNMLLMLGFIATMQSCSKNDLTKPQPTTYTTPDTIINGTIKFIDTTHTVSQQGLSIRYISSSPCYPSNEIFFFTAVPVNIDTVGVTYSWYIQEGQKATILTGKKIQYLYSTACNSYVKLEAYSNGNIIATVTMNINAYGQRANNINVGFQINYSSTTTKNYLAFNSTTLDPIDGYINALFWNFGDGTYDATNNKTPNHTFPSIPVDMNYPVELFVNNSSGCKDSVTHAVTVPASYSLPCKFTFSSKNACTTGEVFTFIADTTGVPSDAEYVWDFKDFTNGYSANPITHQFSYPNRYDVELIIIYKGNQVCNHTDTTVRAVGQNAKPTAYFYGSPKNSDSTSWFFNDLSSFNNGGYLSDILWDFGDGQTQHPSQYSPSLNHTYTATINRTIYNVSMIITDNAGCKDSSNFKVTIPGL